MPKPLAAMLGLAVGAEFGLFVIGKWQVGALSALGCVLGCGFAAGIGLAVMEALRHR